jgi:hypothetical protein
MNALGEGALSAETSATPVAAATVFSNELVLMERSGVQRRLRDHGLPRIAARGAAGRPF